MKIVFLAYRKWALDAISEISKCNPREREWEVLTSPGEYSERVLKPIDRDTIFIAVGWSWLIEPSITRKYLCLGVHPSDLPYYRGGSPIQHQIIDGIIHTKCSLFRLSDRIDSGDVWGQADLSLSGDSMAEVLNNVKVSAIKLLNRFISQFPDINPEPQCLEHGSYKRRRSPEESRINPEEVDFLDIRRLYNKIRSLTEPYPNAFIEDALGNRLYFERVYFVEAKTQ